MDEGGMESDIQGAPENTSDLGHAADSYYMHCCFLQRGPDRKCFLGHPV